jgi:FKBP-type peptidyl-prolyl cis-trans isomerase FkpA
MRGVAVLAAAVLAAAVLACGGAPEEGVPAADEPLGPDEVARTYAPELNVDLERMRRGEGGLRYQDLEEGTGAVAEQGRPVVVHYTGWLPDGTQFDSSHDHGQPFQIVIGQGHVIRGWDVGIPGMREGGTRRLVIPHGMAYGPSGMGPIPPRATLIFDVELLEVR